jgi:hypothetical protein
MADNEKGSELARTGTNTGSYDGSQSVPPDFEVITEQRTGLKGLYYSPTTQVVMLGFVCFMCPGLFNSLNGLGGGGQLHETTSANANSALYSTFAFFAFFAGWVRRLFHPGGVSERTTDAPHT